MEGLIGGLINILNIHTPNESSFWKQVVGIPKNETTKRLQMDNMWWLQYGGRTNFNKSIECGGFFSKIEKKA